jgi:hypothetical protein
LQESPPRISSAMTMPPRYYVTAAAKMPKRAGYSALDDRRTATIVCIRTTAYENVLFNDVGQSTELSDKKCSSAQARRRAFKLFTGRVANWLL